MLLLQDDNSFHLEMKTITSNISLIKVPYKWAQKHHDACQYVCVYKCPFHLSLGIPY